MFNKSLLYQLARVLSFEISMKTRLERKLAVRKPSSCSIRSSVLLLVIMDASNVIYDQVGTDDLEDSGVLSEIHIGPTPANIEEATNGKDTARFVSRFSYVAPVDSDGSSRVAVDDDGDLILPRKNRGTF